MAAWNKAQIIFFWPFLISLSVLTTQDENQTKGKKIEDGHLPFRINTRGILFYLQ